MDLERPDAGHDDVGRRFSLFECSIGAKETLAQTHTCQADGFAVDGSGATLLKEWPTPTAATRL